MKRYTFDIPSCCENCQYAMWLSRNSPYFGMGECYQHFNPESSTGEAILLVSEDFGESCTYFEASEEAEEEYSIIQNGKANFLGLRAGRDFPGSM